MLIDNYFLTAKYGMIREVLKKGKTSIKGGIEFANEHYFVTLRTHILSTLIVIVPLLLLAIVLFLLLPLNNMIAVSLFVPLAIVYLLYVTIRIIFVYPVLTFEGESAYSSVKDGFHFVKAHLHHSFVTWLIVIIFVVVLGIIKNNLIDISNFLFSQLIILGIIFALIIVVIEVTVFTWEHVYIFKSYLEANKKIKV